MLEIIDQGILSHVEGRGAYHPWITPLSNGTFIASQSVGTSLVALDKSIEVLRSNDGKTWVNEGSIHGGGPPTDGYGYGGPQISEASHGRLVMTAGRTKATDDRIYDVESEGLTQRPENLVLWSSDQGRTWSDPEIVPIDLPPEKYTCNGAGSLQKLSPHRWMYPLETWKPEGYDGPPDQKAIAVFSADQGRTWGDLTVIADDPTGNLLWWDGMCSVLPDGRIYTLFWTHRYGTSEDLANHWSISADQGRTWSNPRPTNLPGQVCSPIPLSDGRVAAIYNYRNDPQGIRLALTEDLVHYDTKNELVVFDAGNEATLGDPGHDNFLAEHMQIAFGKPAGVRLPSGNLLTWFWCTSEGITHTRWALIRAE